MFIHSKTTMPKPIYMITIHMFTPITIHKLIGFHIKYNNTSSIAGMS